MNTLTQFASMLDKIEDESLKTELKGAFGNVEGVFNDAIDTRDKAKEKNRKLEDERGQIAKAFEIEGDFTISDLTGKLDSGNTDIEKVKADLTTKYENDLTILRNEIQSKDTAYSELTTKYNDTLFNNAIVESGLLSDFVDEPMARKNITEMVKSKLMYEDGKVFVRDSVTGEKAKDIGTGEFLTPNSVIEDIKGNINPMYLNRETVANGGGTPPTNQSSNSSSAKLDGTKAEREAYIKEKFNK